MKRGRVFVAAPVIVPALMLAGFLAASFVFAGNSSPNVLNVPAKPLTKGIAKERAEGQPSKAEVAQKVQKLKVPFIANNGQVDERVQFYARTFGGTVFVTKDGEIVYSLPNNSSELRVRGSENQKARCMIQDTRNRSNITGRLLCILHHESNIPYCTNCLLADVAKHTGKNIQGVAIKETLVGGRVQEITGNEKAVTKVSSFKGNDPSQWESNISTYDVVSLGEVYDGIELKLKAYGNNVEKLFCVKPDINPDQIQLNLSGAKGLRVNDEGQLEAETELGPVKFSRPVAYQIINGKRVDVGVEYRVESSAAENKSSKHKTCNSKLVSTNPKSAIQNLFLPESGEPKLDYGFKVASYDRTKDLIIDPLLASTFLGGSMEDEVSSLALDTNGNVYVAGWTNSDDFPTTPGAHQETFIGGSFSGDEYFFVRSDVFVSKFNSSLTSLLASTFLGGFDEDRCYALALDTSGNVYVTGYTSSEDFPTTSGAYDTSYNDGGVFVSKLDSGLTSLLASTYLGDGKGRSLTIDTSGNVYVTGTAGSNFPTTSGAYDTSHNGGPDVFVSKLDSGLTSLLASTYLGGSDISGADDDFGTSLALDTSGNVYVTGYAFSSDFPTTSGAYDTSHNWGADVFVSKLNSGLTSLLASTYLGGSWSNDEAYSLALDTGGNVYVTGLTYSEDFPTTSGAYDTSLNGYPDVFVSELDGGLTSLLASTFLGGSKDDVGNSVALDTNGNVYVTGWTGSANFPTTSGAYDTSLNDGDVFVSKLDSGLTSLLVSTYLGGSNSDGGSSLALDTNGDAYVAGSINDSWSGSEDFPTTSGAYDTSHNGGSEVFVTKIPISSAVADAYTAAGTNVMIQPIDAATGETLATITFDDVTQGGTTTVSKFSKDAPQPSGFEVINPKGKDIIAYFEINTTATFQGTATVCYNYPNNLLPLEEQNLKLYHYEDTDSPKDGIPDAWVDVTTSLDTVNDIICGEATSFSPFVIFVENQATTPTPVVSPSPTPQPSPTEPPTAVSLVNFKAKGNGDGSVTLAWETASEVDNAGFNIYRSKMTDGTYKKVTGKLIPAQGSGSLGASYSYEDAPGKGTFYYKLEDVDYNGTSAMHGPVKVRVRSAEGEARRRR